MSSLPSFITINTLLVLLTFNSPVSSAANFFPKLFSANPRRTII